MATKASDFDHTCTISSIVKDLFYFRGDYINRTRNERTRRGDIPFWPVCDTFMRKKMIILN